MERNQNRTIKREKPKKPKTWVIPKIWNDSEVWILGGGPSMPRQFGVPEEVIQQVLNGQSPPSVYSPYLYPIHSRNVIGINASYMIGDWMKVIFFGDKGFFESHRRSLAKYPGLVVTCAQPNSHRYGDYGIKVVKRDGMKAGISPDPNTVRWNHNSGAAAISLAYHLGAKRINLLGFDMKRDEVSNKTHWHAAYNKTLKDKTFERHLRGFPQIAADAKKLGIEVINVSPESAIQSLPKATLKEVI
jgi:hypothetical protein